MEIVWSVRPNWLRARSQKHIRANPTTKNNENKKEQRMSEYMGRARLHVREESDERRPGVFCAVTAAAQVTTTACERPKQSKGAAYATGVAPVDAEAAAWVVVPINQLLGP